MILLLALAGGLGAAARFAVDTAVRRRFPLLPTLVVNGTGSLLLGVLAGLAVGGTVAGSVAAVLGTGFLGGYTTFSAASTEAAQLLAERRTRAAVVTSAGMLVVSVAACAVGLTVGTAAAA